MPGKRHRGYERKHALRVLSEGAELDARRIALSSLGRCPVEQVEAVMAALLRDELVTRAERSHTWTNGGMIGVPVPIACYRITPAGLAAYRAAEGLPPLPPEP